MNMSAQAATAAGPARQTEGTDEAVQRLAVLAPAPPPPRADLEPPVAAADAAERGHTTVSSQAVEHIVARLTAECPAVGGTARRVLGVNAGGNPDDEVVAVRLHGSTAVSLAVRCSVPYPQPVASSTEALRELLMTRVRELTGLRVQRVDITVAELPTSPSGRRVV
jgi:uncharacterized alkaline shock family protein YloU